MLYHSDQSLLPLFTAIHYNRTCHSSALSFRQFSAAFNLFTAAHKNWPCHSSAVLFRPFSAAFSLSMTAHSNWPYWSYWSYWPYWSHALSLLPLFSAVHNWPYSLAATSLQQLTRWVESTECVRWLCWHNQPTCIALPGGQIIQNVYSSCTIQGPDGATADAVNLRHPHPRQQAHQHRGTETQHSTALHHVQITFVKGYPTHGQWNLHTVLHHTMYRLCSGTETKYSITLHHEQITFVKGSPPHGQ